MRSASICRSTPPRAPALWRRKTTTASRSRIESATLASTLCSSTRPCRSRSSGTSARPCAIASRGFAMSTGSPLTRISPDVFGSMPNSTRASALRPLPSRPATPTTSPAWTSGRHASGLRGPLTSSSSSSGAPRVGRVARDVGKAARAPADDMLDDRVERQLAHRRGDRHGARRAGSSRGRRCA